MRTICIIISTTPKSFAQVASYTLRFASVKRQNTILYNQNLKILHLLSGIIMNGIFYGIQMSLTRLFILSSQIIHHMIRCIPAQDF